MIKNAGGGSQLFSKMLAGKELLSLDLVHFDFEV